MKIYLIRHGKTYANERGLYCGSTDSFVSPLGFYELETRKNAGLYSTAEKYFVSPLLRTHQTAKKIFGNVDVIVVPEFAEFDFGLLEMKSHDELLKMEEYREWIDPGNIGATCPGGENNNGFNKRVMNKFEVVKDEAAFSGYDIVILCHGGVIATIMDTCFPEPDIHFYKWLPKGGEGYALSCDSSGKIVEYSNISLDK